MASGLGLRVRVLHWPASPLVSKAGQLVPRLVCEGHCLWLVALVKALVLEVGISCCVLEEWKVGVPCQEFVAELGIEMSHSGTCKASFLSSFSRPCCAESAPASVPGSPEEEQSSPRRGVLSLAVSPLHGAFAAGAGAWGGFSDRPPLQPLQVLAFSIESLKEPKDDTVWREKERQR